MSVVKTATLDADDEVAYFDIAANESAFLTMTITGTITVTWAIAAIGGSNYIALRKSDDSTAAAYTASDYLLIDGGPCRVRATASGVSGGSCVIEERTGITS